MTVEEDLEMTAGGNNGWYVVDIVLGHGVVSSRPFQVQLYIVPIRCNYPLLKGLANKKAGEAPAFSYERKTTGVPIATI